MHVCDRTSSVACLGFYGWDTARSRQWLRVYQGPESKTRPPLALSRELRGREVGYAGDVEPQAGHFVLRTGFR